MARSSTSMASSTFLISRSFRPCSVNWREATTRGVGRSSGLSCSPGMEGVSGLGGEVGGGGGGEGIVTVLGGLGGGGGGYGEGEGREAVLVQPAITDHSNQKKTISNHLKLLDDIFNPFPNFFKQTHLSVHCTILRRYIFL